MSLFKGKQIDMATLDSNFTAYLDSHPAQKLYFFPYAVYTAILAQSGTADPVPTELANTIGSITWTRLGTGSYTGTAASGTFPANKTFVIIGMANSSPFIYPGGFSSTTNINFTQMDTQTATFLDTFAYLPIEIRVYP